MSANSPAKTPEATRRKTEVAAVIRKYKLYTGNVTFMSAKFTRKTPEEKQKKNRSRRSCPEV